MMSSEPAGYCPFYIDPPNSLLVGLGKLSGELVLLDDNMLASFMTEF